MLTGSILILVMLLIYCLYRRLKRNHMVGWASNVRLKIQPPSPAIHPSRHG